MALWKQLLIIFTATFFGTLALWLLLVWFKFRWFRFRRPKQEGATSAFYAHFRSVREPRPPRPSRCVKCGSTEFEWTPTTRAWSCMSCGLVERGVDD